MTKFNSFNAPNLPAKHNPYDGTLPARNVKVLQEALDEASQGLSDMEKRVAARTIIGRKQQWAPGETVGCIFKKKEV